MYRRRTLTERRYPQAQEFVDLARQWSPDGSLILLECVWKGFDALRSEVLSPIGGAQRSDRSLERSITSKLAPRINRALPAGCPFYLLHKPDETETLLSDSAQPPEPDMGFISWINERVMFPLEAKVLPTDGRIADYVTEVTDNFMTCRYGPFSEEGAILGYLLSGNPQIALNNIADRISCELQQHPRFAHRPHKISYHQRTVSPNSAYPVNFCCHHLILEIHSVMVSANDLPNAE